MKYRFMPLLVGAWLAASAATIAVAADAADTDSNTIHFDINRFDIQGNTLLSPQSIDSLVAPFTGKHRDFSNVINAQEALENAYHARGYQLVRVDLPEQELDQGVIRLNVVQIKIGRVKIEGNKYFNDANIRHSLPDLNEWQVPNMQNISKSLKLANENPSKKTIMTMQTGAQDDEVDATLAISDESTWTASANFDNTGNQQTGKTHAGVVLQNANMFGMDDVLSLQYTTTVEKPSQVKVYGAGYHMPLYSLGDSMDFFANYSSVDSGTLTVGSVSTGTLDVAVTGNGAMYGMRYNQNLPTSGSYESKLIYGIDYKAYKSSEMIFGTDFGNSITVHPISATYQGNSYQDKRNLNGAVTLLHNIPGGQRGGQSDFTAARAGAADDYNALRFSASAMQVLPAAWQVRAIINGQYTTDALVAGEQFGAGGASSVRGFEEREVSNDSGVVGNFEVYTPPLCKNANWQCRMLAFYDTAYTKHNHGLQGEPNQISISSIGVGMRLAYGKSVDFQMDYGHVLHAESTLTQTGDNRLHVRLGLNF
ncbi:MAG TPA: ShlB/FhaC/HecB family hemolysin secretion/activation protein [Herbaspirillum sp.]|jgi:hemolysin activation/secretion protein